MKKGLLFSNANSLNVKSVSFLFLISFVLMNSSASFAEHDWTAQISGFKPMVVNIEASFQIVLETDSKGAFSATGFIVDAELGIVATNKHVTGASPSNVKVHFYDGNFTEAKVLYYDPTHDFAFYQIDPKKVNFSLKAVNLGSGRNLKSGDELLLIGNNEKEEYSIKFGKVANLNVNKGDRHSSYIHTTFDRTGGSSGSPVWNTKGEVVAIHARGSDVSSFELPIEYLKNALALLQHQRPIQRGEIGVDLDLISIGEAIEYYGFPEALRSNFEASLAGTPKVMLVESTIPRTTGADSISSGDIIYNVNGQLLKDDLYTFDYILNNSVGKKVILDIYRHGNLLKIEIPVEDMETSKANRFARFAGAIFHDITPHLRNIYSFSGSGVFMTYAEPGSSFSGLWGTRKNGNSEVVISEINGSKIKNLDDFIQACRVFPERKNTYVIAKDFTTIYGFKPERITINQKYGPLGLYERNDKTLDWDNVELKLK